MLERKEGVGDLLTIQQVLSSESEEERKRTRKEVVAQSITMTNEQKEIKKRNRGPY